MNIDLSGKTAAVTGSTGGTGFAIATGLARAGAAVVLNGRKQQAVDMAVARLRAAVPGAAAVRGVAADLGTAKGCAGLVSAEPSADVRRKEQFVAIAVSPQDGSDLAGDRLHNRGARGGVQPGERGYRRGRPRRREEHGAF